MQMPHSMSPKQLEIFLDQTLDSQQFSDYCSNGLQVDGGVHIQRVITGVTACEALIDQAILQQAQAILVHHGYFWKGEPAPLVGMKGNRIRKLMQHGISLFAYHLSLDAHPTLCNNAQLAKLLDVTLTEPLYPHEKNPVGNIGEFNSPITPEQLFIKIHQQLHRTPQHIASGKQQLQRIGICTGAAQDMLEQAAKQGCDVFISGEISERTTHIARELGIDYFACGHHATEKGGIQALGDFLAQNSPLTVNFIDIDNPV